MDNILYIFITHQNNINNIYDRIKNMMNSLNNYNYILVQGGDISNNYDINTKILSINCNDKYEGLPEKVLKTYKYIVESDIFNQYTHFIKLDDDMIIKKIINYNDIENINYGGNVCVTNEGDRKWHMGKCSKNSIWNKTPYKGIYTHWCKGGHGYIISRNAINNIKHDKNYFDNIYEDLYIALKLKKYNIYPININNWVNFFISPEHK
jgi:hypothetical protein